MADERNNNQDWSLSEGQLLDWIEGKLSPDEESALARSAARRGLDVRVKQMQANRRVLASLKDERAPAELADRVLAALERDALLGLASGTPLSDEPPVSSVAPPARRRGPPVIARIFDASPARFAMAAGLLLAVGAGLYLWTVVSGGGLGGSRGPLPGPIATNDEVKPLVLRPEPGGERTAAAGVASSEAAGGPPAAPAVILAAETHEIGLARAVDLARDGRLVMRVIAGNARGVRQIESAAARESPGREWRLTRRVPEGVLAAVLPRAGSSGRGGEAVAMYGVDAASLIGPGAAVAWARPPTVDRASRVRGAYLVDLPADADMMRIVRTVFAGATSATVAFEELPAALDLPRRIEPEDVLWWTQPASRWTARVTVPVVVEER